MKIFTSFFMFLVMIISCFFGGFSQTSEDIIATENSFSSQSLTELQAGFLDAFVDTETAWISSLQLENGAIGMTFVKNGDVTVNPYFADIAALALLDNSDKYFNAVKNYLEWHFAHLNTAESDYNGVDGTIYDYTISVSDGKIVKESVIVKDDKNSYDSTDSYAATFLILLNKYYTVTGDAEYIISRKDDVIRVAEAMISTLDKGLTFAKPDYAVKYLMDNCEVYEGLQATVDLFDKIIFKDDNCHMTYVKFKYAYKWIGQSIEKYLWNSDGGYYYAAITDNGKPAFEFSWSEFYPSATAQLFPIIHSVIPGDSVRANSLYLSFTKEYNWQKLEIPSEFCWGAMALAAAKINDIDRVMEYVNSYIAYSAERSYPLYNADAARVCMAAAYLLNN